MKIFIKWLLVVFLSISMIGCEDLSDQQSNYCNLSMTIDAPSLNLNNRHYIAICDLPIFYNVSHCEGLHFLNDEQHFELSIGVHTMGPKRGNGPEAKLIVRILQRELPFELNKKYLLEPSGDYMESNNYCVVDVRLYLDGECYHSNDGWIKVTKVLDSSSKKFECEFEFTAEKDGEKVVINNGWFASK